MMTYICALLVNTMRKKSVFSSEEFDLFLFFRKPMKIIGFSSGYITDFLITSMAPVDPLPDSPDPDYQSYWTFKIKVSKLNVCLNYE